MEHHHWDFQEKPNPTSDADWEAFQEELSKRYIKVQECPDVLRWGYMTRGSFNIKEAYQIRITHQAVVDDIWKKIWAANLWPKVALFVWLVVRERILTCDNLRKRGVQVPSQCYFCY